MDPEHLHSYIIVPTLDQLGMFSLDASTLLLGTALTESNASYVRQHNGPALGLYQMEPDTHDDIWENWLSYRPNFAHMVSTMAGQWPPGPTAMVGNLWYATAMARLHYFRVAFPLPPAHDALQLASYWKRWYNTEVGLGTVDKAAPHFKAAYEVSSKFKPIGGNNEEVDT